MDEAEYERQLAQLRLVPSVVLERERQRGLGLECVRQLAQQRQPAAQLTLRPGPGPGHGHAHALELERERERELERERQRNPELVLELGPRSQPACERERLFLLWLQLEPERDRESHLGLQCGSERAMQEEEERHLQEHKYEHEHEAEERPQRRHQVEHDLGQDGDASLGHSVAVQRYYSDRSFETHMPRRILGPEAGVLTPWLRGAVPFHENLEPLRPEGAIAFGDVPHIVPPRTWSICEEQFLAVMSQNTSASWQTIAEILNRRKFSRGRWVPLIRPDPTRPKLDRFDIQRKIEIMQTFQGYHSLWVAATELKRSSPILRCCVRQAWQIVCFAEYSDCDTLRWFVSPTMVGVWSHTDSGLEPAAEWWNEAKDEFIAVLRVYSFATVNMITHIMRRRYHFHLCRITVENRLAELGCNVPGNAWEQLGADSDAVFNAIWRAFSIFCEAEVLTVGLTW